MGVSNKKNIESKMSTICRVCDGNHAVNECPKLCRRLDCMIEKKFNRYCGCWGCLVCSEVEDNCQGHHRAHVCNDFKCCLWDYGKCNQRVWGCRDCLPGQDHLCTKCWDDRSDHRARHCPHVGAAPLQPPLHQVNSARSLPSCHQPTAFDGVVEFQNFLATPVGAAASQSLRHQPAKDYSAGMYVVVEYAGKYWVLVQARARTMTPNGQQQYCTPGGLINPGETPKRAAVRELYEEAGVTLTRDHVLTEFHSHTNDRGRTFRAFYTIVDVCIQVLGPEGWSHDEIDLEQDFSNLPGAYFPNKERPIGHAFVPLKGLAQKLMQIGNNHPGVFHSLAKLEKMLYKS